MKQIIAVLAYAVFFFVGGGLLLYTIAAAPQRPVKAVGTAKAGVPE